MGSVFGGLAVVGVAGAALFVHYRGLPGLNVGFGGRGGRARGGVAAGGGEDVLTRLIRTLNNEHE